MSLAKHSPIDLGVQRRHFLATSGAGAAGLGAALHDRIVLEPRAIVGATSTNFGADTACPGVEIRSAMHEVGGQCANLRAVPKQSDVVLLGMHSAHLQTMGHRFHARAVALFAQVDAVLHLVGDFVHLRSSQFAQQRGHR